MANKTNGERVRDYLADIAKTADNLNTVKSLLEDNPDDAYYLERKEAYEKELNEAKRIIGQMENREGYALISRYVELKSDDWMMRKYGYSRSGLYKMLERGIKRLYDYIPTEYTNPKNWRRQ